ncbi:polysaccharide lyase family 8 super-sandwich domain-containing protein [Streptomyces sp. NPDC050504]|uniref:polysaccharide lyase family 8 super-sandwich domain-containing protein n=1 Tax=Streptomyces sp. NPDC050504 TaxID=3365618 RepID=UPI0037903E7F
METSPDTGSPASRRELTRRRLMSALAAAGLLSALPALPAGAADGVASTSADGAESAGSAREDGARLIANAVAVFAGTAQSNARPETAAKLAAVERTARANLRSMDAAGPDELFAGLVLGTDEARLNTAYRQLYEIALATRTPSAAPSDLHENPAVQRRVVDGLGWLHERYYGDQAKGYYGNWFHWEIGISQHITRALALLPGPAEEHRPGLIRAYTASMDAYLRNGVDGDVDLDSRFHTGANLADITANRVLQGALNGDAARIRKALADQLTVFVTVDPYRPNHGVTDGHYADGSFVQHSSVAYTGAYGKGLLTRVVQSLRTLEGTGFADGPALVPTVLGWVRGGFAPLIFEGWMMEAVKGRSVARTDSGYGDVAAVVEAVVDLSALASGADAEALASYAKHLVSASPVPPDTARFVSPVSVARLAEIVADPAVRPADLNPARLSTAFNAMDRTVHRRPGYAFALARSSARISRYEYMNGENLMPWFQGEGAHCLYLSGEDQRQAYGAEHYATVPPYGLAGVTAPVEARRTVPELYGKPYYDNPGHPLRFTASSESQNTYVYFPRGTHPHSGGTVLGPYGTAAMVHSPDVPYRDRHVLPDDFVVYLNARATKSWYLFDDEIVVLAAGIGDAAGRAVTTTADARTAAPGDAVTVTGGTRDGRPWPGPGTGSAAAPLDWLRCANATRATSVGYVFLRTPPVRVSLSDVTASLRTIRTANPDTPVTRKVLSVTFDHAPAAPPAALAYALLPHATESALRSYRRKGPLRILSLTHRLQALAHTGLGLTALNSFSPGPHDLPASPGAPALRVDGPASVLVRRTHRDTFTVAVSDPTTERDTVALLLRGRHLHPVSTDDAVKVTRTPRGTLLETTTHHAYGRGFTATLRG